MTSMSCTTTSCHTTPRSNGRWSSLDAMSRVGTRTGWSSWARHHQKSWRHGASPASTCKAVVLYRVGSNSFMVHYPFIKSALGLIPPGVVQASLLGWLDPGGDEPAYRLKYLFLGRESVLPVNDHELPGCEKFFLEVAVYELDTGIAGNCFVRFRRSQGRDVIDQNADQ